MARLYLHELSQPEAERVLAETRTAVVVAGSVEQHGPHLPLGTDWIAALGIGERVARLLGAPLTLLSPVGVAPYHGSWPGSLSLRPATLVALFVDVSDGLVAAGVERLLVVNWHEGNTATLRLAAQEAQLRHRGLQVVIAETHVAARDLSGGELPLTHAGSLETAAVLAVDDGLVDVALAVNATPDDVGDEGHELFRRPDVFPVLRDFRDVAPTGWYGRPDEVTRERAEELFARVAAHVVARAREAWDALDERRRGS
jgi:creatinine amidohydrolase